LTPHGAVALSSSLTTAKLMLVRSSKVRSSSILPTSERDADLLGDVDRALLERVLVADRVDEWDEDVEAGAERLVEPAQPLDHVGVLLRHDDRGPGDHDDREHGQHGQDDQTFGHSKSPFPRWLDPADPQLEPVDPLDEAALTRAQVELADVADAPDRAAQLGRPGRVRREVPERDGNLADQLADRRSAGQPETGGQTAAEQQEAGDRQEGEEQHLQRDAGRHPGEGE
jgi:hypothetical protein